MVKLPVFFLFKRLVQNHCLINVLSVFFSVEIYQNITWPLLNFFWAKCSCSRTEVDLGLVKRWLKKEPNAVDVYKEGGLSVIIHYRKILPPRSATNECVIYTYSLFWSLSSPLINHKMLGLWRCIECIQANLITKDISQAFFNLTDYNVSYIHFDR